MRTEVNGGLRSGRTLLCGILLAVLLNVCAVASERWDGKDSHNHPMFGGGLVWLYRKVAGVQADESDPGYRHVIFRPQPVGDLTWASYETETPYGKVSASWKIRRGRFIYKVHIPRGTRGSVWMPGSDTPVELGPGTRRLVAKL